MPILSGLASKIVEINLAGARPRFELAFRQIQQGVVNRLNGEIEKVQESGETDIRKLEALSSEAAKLELKVPPLEQYIFVNQGNLTKLKGMETQLTSLTDALSLEDTVDNFTANEIASYEEAREELLATAKTLFVVALPDYYQTDLISDLRKDIYALSELTPTVGAVDPEGTVNPNVNRQIIDAIADLTNKASTVKTVTSDSISLGLEFKLDVNKKLAEITAEQVEISTTKADEKLQEIENLKIDYANLLKVISISFESSLNYSEQLSSSLNLDRPIEKGSVLNLFS